MRQDLDRLDGLADAQEMAHALSVALGTGPAMITLRRDRTTIVARVDRFGAATLRARYRADHATERRRRSLARAALSFRSRRHGAAPRTRRRDDGVARRDARSAPRPAMKQPPWIEGPCTSRSDCR
jgi:hypothetical protein